jgi:predicted N-acyltransferase
MDHFTIIGLENSTRWDDIVRSFKDYDVYYLSNYAKSFEINGDGDPILFFYCSNHLKGINVVLKRDISDFDPLKGVLPAGAYFDIVTPYGYGGFILEGKLDESEIIAFYKEYETVLNKEKIVSEFIRYHPVLKNAEILRNIAPIDDLGFTISMDLKSNDVIWENLTSKNRNMVRKAQKSGIEIHHGNSIELQNDFIEMYYETMNYGNVSPYYLFSKKYFDSLRNGLLENHKIFYATLGNKKIAMAIILYANQKMNYHLSGSLNNFRGLAPNNLLLYEVASWGCKNGFKSFHLGGGVGATEDSLFSFKKGFNRYSKNIFAIGKNICNKEIYDILVRSRADICQTFDTVSTFFPLYRANVRKL